METANYLTFAMTADEIKIVKVFDDKGQSLLAVEPEPEPEPPPKKVPAVAQPVVDAQGNPVLDAEGKQVMALPKAAPTKPVIAPPPTPPPVVPTWTLKDPESTLKMEPAKDGLSAKFTPTGVLTAAIPAEVSVKVEKRIGHFFMVVKPGKSFSFVCS